MVTNVGSWLAAFQANQKSIETSAHNIANVNTPNYKSVVTTQQEGPGGQVVAESSLSEAQGMPFPPGLGNPSDFTSNVDMVREMVGLINSGSSLEANLRSAGIIDKLTGDLIAELR